MNISTIVSELYRAYAPKLAKAGAHLDIDIPDPTVKPKHPSAIEKACAAYFNYCLKHPEKSDIVLTVKKREFVLIDDTRLMMKDDQAVFAALATTTHVEIKVRSRLGFGTRVIVPLGE